MKEMQSGDFEITAKGKKRITSLKNDEKLVSKIDSLQKDKVFLNEKNERLEFEVETLKLEKEKDREKINESIKLKSELNHW
jgi:hypothetical protein